MGYSNSTKVIIYFDPKTHRINRTTHCYIAEYDVKIHLEESLYISDIMLQEHPSGVYQPGTTYSDTKIIPIQPSLDLSDLTFTFS